MRFRVVVMRRCPHQLISLMRKWALSSHTTVILEVRHSFIRDGVFRVYATQCIEDGGYKVYGGGLNCFVNADTGCLCRLYALYCRGGVGELRYSIVGDYREGVYSTLLNVDCVVLWEKSLGWSKI